MFRIGKGNVATWGKAGLERNGVNWIVNFSLILLDDGHGRDGVRLGVRDSRAMRCAWYWIIEPLLMNMYSFEAVDLSDRAHSPFTHS